LKEVEIMNCRVLVKKIRLQSYARHVDAPAVINRLEAPCGAGGGPPEREGPQGRPMPPPYLLEQDRIDEIPAESGAVFYAAGPLISRLQEKLNFLFKEEFGNKFVEFKGEWIETKHTGYVQLPGGGWKHQSTVSYCYVLTRELLDGYLLDNRTWRSMMPNVVPKRVPSLLDVIKEPQKYKDNSYARCIVEALSYKKAYFIAKLISVR
jgi:hypothetical protein